jgi:membrane-associated phospholipid phosphatase
MRPLALIAYIGMMAATPLVGGHYFIDVFAGVGLAVLAIVAAGLIGERSSRPVPARMQNAVTA